MRVDVNRSSGLRGMAVRKHLRNSRSFLGPTRQSREQAKSAIPERYTNIDMREWNRE